jgi:hypothetical protein
LQRHQRYKNAKNKDHPKQISIHNDSGFGCAMTLMRFSDQENSVWNSEQLPQPLFDPTL